MTRRAQTAHEYMPVLNTGRNQLITRRPPGVKKPVILPADRRKGGHRPGCSPKQQGNALNQASSWPELNAARSNRVPDVRTDFVAARRDCRSDRDDEILGARAEVMGHTLDGGHRSVLRESSPSGVHSRHDTEPRIGHQDRHAVGGLNGERKPWNVADHDIRLRLNALPWAPASSPTMGHDRRAVDLLQAREPRRMDVHRLGYLSPGVFVFAERAVARAATSAW